MNYYGYDIDATYILPGTASDIKWSITGNGEYIVGTKKGIKYFIKRYSGSAIRWPAKTMPEPIHSQMLNAAQALECKQNEIMSLFSSLKVDKDHIVVEEENFWDSNMFVTVTRMIDGENFDADYSTLDTATFIQLCTDIATLIQKIHKAGVTHGDLKIKNLLIKYDSSGLVPYLIDFDSSYPSDYATRTNSEGKTLLAYPVVYSDGYQSPEIALYNYEEEGVISPATITNKTDIFTLAIIFHELWTNVKPAVVGDTAIVGEAVCMGMPIKINSKFDISLGSKFDNKFSALLNWMLQKDPETRPTADQVIAVLEDSLEIDDAFAPEGAAPKFDSEPHDAHKKAVSLLTREELRAKGVRSLLKVIDGGQYKYLVKLGDGSEHILTVDELISQGYATSKNAAICDLWEEDATKYEFVDAAEIDSRGVSAIERRGNDAKHFYFILYRDGRCGTCGVTGLIAHGVLQPRKATPDPDFEVNSTDTPWPEDGVAYNLEALANRGIIKIETVTEDGVHKYRLTMKRDGGTVQSVVKSSYMKLMNFIL